MSPSEHASVEVLDGTLVHFDAVEGIGTIDTVWGPIDFDVELLNDVYPSDLVTPGQPARVQISPLGIVLTISAR